MGCQVFGRILPYGINFVSFCTTYIAEVTVYEDKSSRGCLGTSEAGEKKKKKRRRLRMRRVEGEMRRVEEGEIFKRGGIGGRRRAKEWEKLQKEKKNRAKRRNGRVV